jgi:prophage tail gpP-like protein
MAEVAEIVSGGRSFAGWKKIEVTASIEAFCRTFRFEVSEKHPDDIEARVLRRGDPVEVKLEGERVITGSIDDVRRRYNESDHTIEIAGRGKTKDLVDCSASNTPGEWNNLNALQLGTAIANPFAVEVTAETDVGAIFPKFSLQASETAASAIIRAANQRGLLLAENSAGVLVFIRAQATPEPLPIILGTEILSGSVSDSEKDRYSTYTVKGQQPGGDTSTAEQSAAAVGVALDPEIARFRPLQILAERPGDNAAMEKRALYEAARRAGRAHRPTVQVREWRNAAGSLWRPNTIARVRDEFLELNSSLLISAVRYVSDKGGRRVYLQLGRKEAYDVLALPEKAESETPELWTDTD